MNFELFQNIDYKNIINLHTITQEYSGNLELIKKIYSRNNKHINENLNFLINIKFFEINKNHINILGEIDKELIFSLIFNQPNYAICIKNYLLNFQDQLMLMMKLKVVEMQQLKMNLYLQQMKKGKHI